MTQPEHRQRIGSVVEEGLAAALHSGAAAPGRPILLGDRIENPGNAAALQAVASMFGWDCGSLRGSGRTAPPECEIAGAQTRSLEELMASGTRVIALENTDGADDLYGFRPPADVPLALVVGNERKGVTREVLGAAYQTLRIPVASRQINTVNVAAAAAIALYFLSQGGRGRLRFRPKPRRSRPELLIAGPTDPIEVGSVLRSATAFGWERVLLDDPHGVWFCADRVTRSLGRGAARRGRNGIHVLPADGPRSRMFAEACIITTGEGEPLERADLARGPEQLIVIPDQSGALGTEPELGRIARRVRRIRLGLHADFAYRFRLIASIVLAEVARQVGVHKGPQRTPSGPVGAPRRAPFDAEEGGNF